MKPKEREAWALEAVRKKYEAQLYTVSKAKDRGADLIAIKGDEKLRIEVKGYTKSWGYVDMTRREFQRLMSDQDFRIAEVNEVDGEPYIRIFTRDNIQKIHMIVRIRVWLK